MDQSKMKRRRRWQNNNKRSSYSGNSSKLSTKAPSGGVARSWRALASVPCRVLLASAMVWPILAVEAAVAADSVNDLWEMGASGRFARAARNQDNEIPVFTSAFTQNRPDFGGVIHNITVNVGREAVLECHVNHLGRYKVGWLKAKDQTILALHKRVITHNPRIAVDHEENRIWMLKIRQVQESDRGCYMCQINTEEMKKQIGCIDVMIPPNIDDVKTSSDVIVNEGDDATLVCRAQGHPTPRINWLREDKKEFPVYDSKYHNHSRRAMVTRFQGEILTMKKVQRHQMGAYLCIASNDVPPAVSKRIILNVNFQPEITVPSQLYGVGPGTDVTISCRVQAYPTAINYWMKDDHEMLLDGPKYNITEKRVNSYERVMYLTIKNWAKADESHFSCISTNSLGKADGRIQSYTYVSNTEANEEPEPTQQDYEYYETTQSKQMDSKDYYYTQNGEEDTDRSGYRSKKKESLTEEERKNRREQNRKRKKERRRKNHENETTESTITRGQTLR